MSPGNSTGSTDRVAVGRVIRAHGVSGELKVVIEADHPDHVLSLERVFLGHRDDRTQEYTVASMRRQVTRKGLLLIVALDGVDDREAADNLRDLTVYAKETDLPELDEHEYFLHDFEGLTVDLVSGEIVGSVREVLELPAHGVLVVERSNLPDVMIPMVTEFIDRVDMEEKVVTIKPLEGLLD